jgi:two-component system NtrC family sensor kinase
VHYHWLIPLAAALANLVIFVPVLRQGIHDRLHRVFAAMTLVIVIWNLDVFSLWYFPDAASAEWWSRFLRTGVCFAPAVVLHFALILSGSDGPRWRRVLLGAYGLAAALAVANLTGRLVHSVTAHTWGWYVAPTRLYSVFSASLLLSFLLSGERIWRTHRTSGSPRQRVQAKFWLLASLVAMPFALTNLLPIYGFLIYPLGNLGNVFYVWIVGYAIVRHRLMDVDYIVRKVVSFSLAALVVLLPGGAALGALARSLGSEEPLLIAFAGVALGLVAVVLIPALQEAVETRVQRVFFPHRYDYRRRLRLLASELTHVLNEAELVRRLGAALADILDLEACAVFVRDERTQRLAIAYPQPAGAPEGLPDDIAAQFDALAAPILASEAEEMGGPAATLFRSRGWEVGIPLRINDRPTGFVMLGRNRDFRIFSGEDLQLLAAVASGASVALENASLSRQLRRSEVVIERANRLSSLGMLAAGIAHEIRNPLVAVKTFLDLLPQRLDDREFLGNFRDLSLGELRRVTDLIADLLALGKSKTAERRAVDLPATLEPVVRLMESAARKRQIEVAARFQAGLPRVWADPDQLKQIVLNLILNAIESGGGHVALEVRSAAGERIVLEVRDDGPGIPPEQLEGIFHPFFTTKETGTGLGLALVHQMVVEHGGEITVESESGRGTVFRVALPAAQLDLAATGT